MAMTDETVKNLELLKRKMESDIPPVLFTGAGFSYGATNSNKQKLPLGEGLKKLLLTEVVGYDENSDEYKELLQSRLDSLYEYVKRNYASQSKEFLIKLFSGVQPDAHHRIIAEYPWLKIYTVNIDDLIENTLPAARLNAINSASFISSQVGKTDYIKLHGCVRNHDGGFIFATTEYYDKINGPLDFRFSKLIEDYVSKNMVFIGTSGDEVDMSLYLLKYGIGHDTGHGNIFIVNPAPKILQTDEIHRTGAHLIQLKTEEFADWMKKNLSYKKGTKIQNIEQRFKINYRDVGTYVGVNGSRDNSDTRLYMGDNPTWIDISQKYDFQTPSAETIVSKIEESIRASNENIIYTLLSKAVGGKSVHLKRVGMELLNKGYRVYEFIGTELKSADFLSVAPYESDIAVLLVDNASGYYASIARIIEQYPPERRVIVIAASRPYYHYKKYYDLRHFPTYNSIDIDREQRNNSQYFASVGKDAVTTLKDKGLLGKLRKLDDDARIKEFVKRKDIPEVLWNLFEGSEMRDRLFKAYTASIKQIPAYPGNLTNVLVSDILLALAIFSDRDLVYIPYTLLSYWLKEHQDKVLRKIEDITKRDDNGVSLRTNLLVKHIITNSTREDRLRIIKTVLRKIAPYIRGPKDTYWHQIQSRLMNGTYLTKELKISQTDVRGLFSSLIYYYDHDANFYLQYGRVEQSLGQYEVALNRFIQAQTLSPAYYNVRNAIARNHLLQSYKDRKVNAETAERHYQQGFDEMIRLIEEKEQYQVRAYSIHSLTVESVKYWKTRELIPTKEILQEIFEKLQEAVTDFPDDKRMRHACKVLFTFVKENNLQRWLPSDAQFRLLLVKAYDAKDLTEDDFENDDLE